MKKDLRNLILILLLIVIIGGAYILFIAPNISQSFISIPKAYASSILSGGST